MSGKNKKDSFSLLKKLVIIFAVITICAAAALLISNSMIKSEYAATVQRIETENQTNSAKFESDMNALRAKNQTTRTIENTVETEETLSTWEKEIDGVTWTLTDESNRGLENTRTETFERNELMIGGLLLVNQWHAIPEDFSEEALLPVGSTSNFSIQVENNTVMLFPAAYSALKECIDDGKAQGIDHFIVREGYRSKAAQQELFNNKMQKLSTTYSGNRLIEETKKAVNFPGTSDYNTGLTVRMDIYQKGSTERKKFQAESEQGAWLTENCWKYGFIFRFPTKDFPNSSWEDKSYKTGVSSQLNMYRFVGKPHAAVMHMTNMCLEEYIEFLHDHGHICLYVDGALKYEIVRLRADDGQESYTLPVVNQAADYEASLDNMGCAVIAYTY